jgi:hypothetical protein
MIQQAGSENVSLSVTKALRRSRPFINEFTWDKTPDWPPWVFKKGVKFKIQI